MQRDGILTFKWLERDKRTDTTHRIYHQRKLGPDNMCLRVHGSGVRVNTRIHFQGLSWYTLRITETACRKLIVDCVCKLAVDFTRQQYFFDTLMKR